MWTFLKKFLARSKSLNAALGDVMFETPEVSGQNPHSVLQWRVKKVVEGGGYFVGLRMLPDAYMGPEGSPTNYMNFDIESAQRLRFNLDRCIDEYYRLTRGIPPEAINSPRAPAS